MYMHLWVVGAKPREQVLILLQLNVLTVLVRTEKSQQKSLSFLMPKSANQYIHYSRASGLIISSEFSTSKWEYLRRYSRDWNSGKVLVTVPLPLTSCVVQSLI